MAWHSIHKSMMWFLQMAQVSMIMSAWGLGTARTESTVKAKTRLGEGEKNEKVTTKDLPHAQRATAFHFLTSNLFFGPFVDFSSRTSSSLIFLFSVRQKHKIGKKKKLWENVREKHQKCA